MLESYNLKNINIDKLLGSYNLKNIVLSEKNAVLTSLIKNRELDISEIQLRVYYDYSGKNSLTDENFDQYNKERIKYYMVIHYDEKNKDEEDKNNVKVKKIQE